MDWEECVQNKAPLALMMVDIDDFRVYNTLHGLYGGDLCLQWIADALKIIGEHYGASISRYGGGTFILKLKTKVPNVPMNWPRRYAWACLHSAFPRIARQRMGL